MSASTTFQRISSSLMPQVSMVPLFMMTKTVHPNYCGISSVCHMYLKMSNRHIQCSVCGGVFQFYLGYASRSHCLKCSARRWVCLPALRGHMQQTSASTSAYDGVSLLTLTGSACVARGKPYECGYYL